MGKWIFKKELDHHCNLPNEDLNRERIGSHSVWQCWCGQFWSTGYVITTKEGTLKAYWNRIKESDVETLRSMPEGSFNAPR